MFALTFAKSSIISSADIQTLLKAKAGLGICCACLMSHKMSRWAIASHHQAPAWVTAGQDGGGRDVSCHKSPRHCLPWSQLTKGKIFICTHLISHYLKFFFQYLVSPSSFWENVNTINLPFFNYDEPEWEVPRGRASSPRPSPHLSLLRPTCSTSHAPGPPTPQALLAQQGAPALTSHLLYVSKTWIILLKRNLRKTHTHNPVTLAHSFSHLLTPTTIFSTNVDIPRGLCLRAQTTLF